MREQCDFGVFWHMGNILFDVVIGPAVKVRVYFGVIL